MWPFIQTNLNTFYPEMPCAKFGRSWASGSGENDFDYVVNLLLPFKYSYLPLECGLSFEKKTSELPFTHECFVPLVEIGPVVLVKKKKMLSKKLQINRYILFITEVHNPLRANRVPQINVNTTDRS